MRELFVIIEYNDTSSMLLGMEAKDAKGCEQMIAWQRKGGFSDDDRTYHVCRYDAKQRFVSITSGKAFSPSRSPFTQEAWDAFFDKMNTPTKWTPETARKRVGGTIGT